MNIVFVTGHKELWDSILTKHEIVSPMEYLMDERFVSGKYRVINLCKDYSYQSKGYYVSLLAEARGHKIIPPIMTVQDSKSHSIIESLQETIEEDIEHCLKPIKSDEFILSVYFGKNLAAKYDKLCRKLYGFFPHPMFRVVFHRSKRWRVKKIQVLSITDLIPSHYEFLAQAVDDFCQKRFYKRNKGKKVAYDIAMLYNPNEACPPSDRQALKKFVKAGEDLGLSVTLITKDDYRFISEYDGLFIRETTSVNHHTYRFARKAQAEGLLTIDDPESILKCTNKVYLAEYLNKNNIPSPKTWIISANNYRDYLAEIEFPCVIKLPDSSFSQGVKKVEDKAEYLAVMKKFFQISDLLIVQSYTPSEYDWRIGIIDNQVFYACRYYMAKDHWQIIDWKDGKKTYGNFETLPIDEVPDAIKKTALKATRGIGCGLYGVDLKIVNNKPYIIEVNDNPSIDEGVEDKIKECNVYDHIMRYFLKYLNELHGHV